MNKVIFDYDICCGNSHADLAEAVLKSIQRGWQPYGSMVIDTVAPMRFYQSMVRYQEVQAVQHDD